LKLRNLDRAVPDLIEKGRERDGLRFGQVHSYHEVGYDQPLWAKVKEPK
jgi:hypothetical protein